MENGDKNRNTKIVRISETQNSEQSSHRTIGRSWMMSFNIFFPLGLLGFVLFWTGILLKLYLPRISE